MFKRLFKRTALFALLTAAAFGTLELLVFLGHEQFDINNRFPELIYVMVAVAVQAWGEISIMWFRLILTPEMDMQKIGNAAAEKDPVAAAIIFASKQIVWAVRVIAFLFLYGIQVWAK